jgi:hypothetical protein
MVSQWSCKQSSCLTLLIFWTLSIVRYANEQNIFWKLDLLPTSGEECLLRWVQHKELIPMAGPSYHTQLSSYSSRKNRSRSSSQNTVFCSSEHHTIDIVQKTSNMKYNTSLSELLSYLSGQLPIQSTCYVVHST